MTTKAETLKAQTDSQLIDRLKAVDHQTMTAPYFPRSSRIMKLGAERALIVAEMKRRGMNEWLAEYENA